MQLETAMIPSKVVDPGGLGAFHFEDHFSEDSFQFVEPCQGDLLDLEEPMLLVPDFADLVTKIVQLPMSKSAH
jgi:hypothetical protein